MKPSRMHLKVLLPFQVHSENLNVLSIVAETSIGSFGILPNRRDCVAILPPGLLTYQTENDGEFFLAIDEGVLVKRGHAVEVAIRRGVQGEDLETLNDTVQATFVEMDEEERVARSALSRLEAGIVRRFGDLRRPRI